MLTPAVPAPFPVAAADEEALEAKCRLVMQASVVPICLLADIGSIVGGCYVVGVDTDEVEQVGGWR